MGIRQDKGTPFLYPHTTGKACWILTFIMDSFMDIVIVDMDIHMDYNLSNALILKHLTMDITLDLRRYLIIWLITQRIYI